MYKRNLIRLISRKLIYVETLLYLKSGLFFFENVVKDIEYYIIKYWILCHKVWNITLSIIYIWNPCMFWTNGFCFILNERKGGNFFILVKVCLFLYIEMPTGAFH